MPMNECILGIHLGNTCCTTAISEPEKNVLISFQNVLGRREVQISCSFYRKNGHLIPSDEVAETKEPNVPLLGLDLSALRDHPKGSETPSQEVLVERVLRRIAVNTILESGWIGDVVLSVPNYLDKSQRHLLKQICSRIGLRVKRILSHHLAILYEYGFEDLPRDEILAVVRIGGSTLSVQILSLAGDKMEMLANMTKMDAGTQRLELVLLQQISGLLEKKHGIELNENSLQRVRKKLEATRRYLRPGPPMDLDLVLKGAPKNILLESDDLWSGTHTLHQEIDSFLIQAVREAGVKPGMIRRLFVAGGGARVPYLVNSVKDALSTEPSFANSPPEEVIARGAATNGYWLRHGRPPPRKRMVPDMLEATVLDSATIASGNEKTLATAIGSTHSISFVTVDSPDKPIVFENQDEISMGRSSGSDLTLDIPAISRTHAKMEYHDGAFFLEDRSSNGTFVNGKKMVKLQRCKIKAGDLITLASEKGPWIKVVSIF